MGNNVKYKDALYIILDLLRNILFLIIGLLFLNAIENSFIKEFQKPWLMLPYMIANLALLYVFYRNFLGNRTFYKAFQKNSMSKKNTFLITVVSILIIAAVAYLQ
ncbi:hypothetical protein [Paenibacillus azoreducens]|uniref:Uncharacterized protein n=1 Tax=Paenibacillus azoreducens TaxID=116718 RepID=A0A920CPK7_9BACL|nr:hypothetical protein [Paenibacillus azoreducens]GIO48791.1 hypothetical protein J34TS1_35560 [Paenibacillus azoreducens]